jgi:PAS domain S-box-containing protein
MIQPDTRKTYKRSSKQSDAIRNSVSLTATADDEAKPLYKFEIMDDQLQTIFDYSPHACYLTDLCGVFIYGNIATRRLTGFEPIEMFRKNLFQLKLLPPEDIQTVVRSLTSITNEKTSGPDQLTIRRKDGEKLPVEVQSFLISIEHMPVVLNMVRIINTQDRVSADVVKLQH